MSVKYAGDDSLQAIRDWAREEFLSSSNGAILRGTEEPSASLGEDGDIYLKRLESDYILTSGGCMVSTRNASLNDTNSGWTTECTLRIQQATTESGFLFGGVNSFAYNQGWWGVWLQSGENGKVCVYQSESNSSRPVLATLDITQADLIDGNYHTIKLDGANVYVDDVLSYTFDFTPAVTIPIDIFAVYRGDVTANVEYSIDHVSISEIKVSDNGTLVCDLIPYDNNGIITFIETVTNTALNVYGTTANLSLLGAGSIAESYLKSSGSWQPLIGSNINDVSTGIGTISPLSVSANGTYTPPQGVDGYAPVVVDVESGGSNATFVTALTTDLGTGFVANGTWNYDPDGGSYSDVYAVESGRTYFAAIGATCGNRFRVLFSVINPASLTSSYLEGSRIGTDKDNPTGPLTTPIFTPSSDGYITIGKTNERETGLVSYLIDITDIIASLP